MLSQKFPPHALSPHPLPTIEPFLIKQTKEEVAGTLEAVQAIQNITQALQKSKENYTAKCVEQERLKKEGATQREIEKVIMIKISLKLPKYFFYMCSCVCRACAHTEARGHFVLLCYSPLFPEPR